MSKLKKSYCVKISASISKLNNKVINEYIKENDTDRSKVIRSLIAKNTENGKLVL